MHPAGFYEPTGFYEMDAVASQSALCPAIQSLHNSSPGKIAMKTSRLLILAFLLLAVGIWLIASYCQGTAGFDTGIPVSGTKLHIEITTTGYPALIGLCCTVFGLLFLCLAFLSAIAKEIIVRRNRAIEPTAIDPYPPPA